MKLAVREGSEKNDRQTALVWASLMVLETVEEELRGSTLDSKSPPFTDPSQDENGLGMFNVVIHG